MRPVKEREPEEEGEVEVGVGTEGERLTLPPLDEAVGSFSIGTAVEL